MNFCIVFQMYLAMAQAHLATPADHMKIAEGGNYLKVECDKFEAKENKKEEKKINKEKIGK